MTFAFLSSYWWEGSRVLALHADLTRVGQQDYEANDMPTMQLFKVKRIRRQYVA